MRTRTVLSDLAELTDNEAWIACFQWFVLHSGLANTATTLEAVLTRTQPADSARLNPGRVTHISEEMAKLLQKAELHIGIGRPPGEEKIV